MKVCVTAGGRELDDPVDPRFGRSPFLVLVDTETRSVEAFPNEGATAAGGAGIQSAQAISRMGARALITGQVGPNALQTLSAAGIEVFLHQGGTVRDAVDRFTSGDLKKIDSPTAPPHAGMGQRGMGRGRSGPGSRGQGKGRGGSSW